MAFVFGLLCAVAMAWSAFKFFEIKSALREKMPPEFQDGLSSRFAVGVYALEPSTPLKVQADYVTLSAVGSVAMICFALAATFAGQMTGLSLAALGAAVSIVSTIKAWLKYRDNCNRRTSDTGAGKAQ